MNKRKVKAEDTLIGIDYGESRTGLSLGKNSLVTPLFTLKDLPDPSLIHEIIKIAMENKVAAFVLGIPLQADGKETKQSLKVRAFGKLLKILSRKPVFMQNEFGSTTDSIKEAIENGVPQNKRSKNDHLAAALILRSFYTEQDGDLK
jgi:putative Holliday junction resolvase